MVKSIDADGCETETSRTVRDVLHVVKRFNEIKIDHELWRVRNKTYADLQLTMVVETYYFCSCVSLMSVSIDK